MLSQGDDFASGGSERAATSKLAQYIATIGQRAQRWEIAPGAADYNGRPA
jgi:hypothetical protein